MTVHEDLSRKPGEWKNARAAVAMMSVTLKMTHRLSAIVAVVEKPMKSKGITASGGWKTMTNAESHAVKKLASALKEEYASMNAAAFPVKSEGITASGEWKDANRAAAPRMTVKLMKQTCTRLPAMTAVANKPMTGLMIHRAG